MTLLEYEILTAKISKKKNFTRFLEIIFTAKIANIICFLSFLCIKGANITSN